MSESRTPSRQSAVRAELARSCTRFGQAGLDPGLLELPVERVPGDAEELGRSSLVPGRLPESLGDGPDLEVVEAERRPLGRPWRSGPAALAQPGPHVLGPDRGVAGGQGE